MSPHLKRILTAIIALPVLWFGIQSGGFMLFGLVLLVSSLGLWEFFTLFWPDKQNLVLKTVGILFGAAILYSAFIEDLWIGFVAFLVLFWSVNLIFLILYGSGKTDPPYTHLLILLAGQFYLTLMLQFFFHFKAAEIVFILLATFASDTGAFYSGRYLGRKKLWPAISPKKTWMGALGGLVCTVLLALVFGFFWGQGDWILFLIAGTLVSLAAQTGDLFESAIKRSLRVKDSGKVLPGHGGILDRVDGLLLALPIFAALRKLVVLF